MQSLPITAVVATKNEEINISRCIKALTPAKRTVVVDSASTDDTVGVAGRAGAEVVQFEYPGGYPKKRQWAIDNIDISTPWVLLIDADEVVPAELWTEIQQAVEQPTSHDAYLVTKGFRFLGRQFRFGGFSHSAVVLFRVGHAQFERLLENPPDSQDMEVHERLIVKGRLGQLRSPLIHEDFKGLEAYVDRHNKYSTWEALVRIDCRRIGGWGEAAVQSRLLGNVQEQRRFLKSLAMKAPFEPQLWFLYHYFLRLGFLEGRPGLIASRLRANYIADVRAKIYELERNTGAKQQARQSSSNCELQS